MIQPQTWISIVFFAICTLLSTLLLFQGYINVRYGRITKFGLDAFWYFVDIQVRRRVKIKAPSRWNEQGMIKRMGILTLLLALVLARTSARIFLENIFIILK
jgi:hypothetical protein